MGVILDTSVLIAAERRTLSMHRLLDDEAVDGVGIAAITVSELLQGSLRTARADLRMRRAAFVDAITSQIPVLPFGTVEARRHADLWVHLLGQGAMIGLHDLLIAATALANGHAVATLDTKDFQRIPGLRLVDAAQYG
jgi:predicted nucleic acid-binding protein